MDYQCVKWKKIRGKILRRDEYLCRECRRYGKTKEATTVHHIKPASKYPELKFNINNLYSCCESCHNSFHNRNTDELTDKGLQLVDRINRIYPLPDSVFLKSMDTGEGKCFQ